VEVSWEYSSHHFCLLHHCPHLQTHYPHALEVPFNQIQQNFHHNQFSLVLKELPHFILEEIEQIEDLNLYQLDSLVLTLQDFIKDCRCPLTNLTFSPPADPLENNQ
jgi:hypothetical protein